MRILRAIDRLMFKGRDGVTYRWYEKVFAWLGVGMAIWGIIRMLLFVGSANSAQFYLAVAIALVGILVMMNMLVVALQRKVKEGLQNIEQ